MRFLAFAGLCLATSSFALSQESKEISLATRAAFTQFQQDNGGASSWIARWHPATGTPTAIYGTGLKIDDWQKNSLEEARRHAVQVLKDRADILGLGESDFIEIIGSRMGRTWSFTFEQSFRGVPAVSGRADVRINMAGVVAMMGSQAWPIPKDFNTTPTITSNVAIGAAWASLGGEPSSTQSPARLVIWGDMNSPTLAPFSLAWEVAVHSDSPEGEVTFGRYYIDAITGRVLHFANDKHDCGLANCQPKSLASKASPTPTTAVAAPLVTLTETPSNNTIMPTLTTVTLMAWTRTGNDAASALQNVPLPNININIAGIGPQTTDANGEFEIDITAPVTINMTGLDGTHFSPITGPDSPSGSVTVNPGVNATIQLLSANASTNEAAHTTAAYWTDRSNTWARSILGNSPALDFASNVNIAVNIPNTCNAYYTGNTINFYQAGGSCSNTAFSSVIAHEWGHGLDDHYGGISNSNTEGLSEGWGDIIGLYQLDSPLLGSGFQSSGVPLRNGNNNFVYPYSSGSPHGAGQVWMGWAWRFREILRASMGTPAAIALSEQLVIGSIVANAGSRPQAVLEVFIADDDDGNVLNGTPHYAELESASIQKGIPYPEIVVISAQHTPLSDTSLRLLARQVAVTAFEVSETITSITMTFDDGTGPVTRDLKPTGFTNQYLGMLPGLDTGSMSYHIDIVHTGGSLSFPETGDYTYSMTTGLFSGFYIDTLDNGQGAWTSGTNAGTNDWQLGNPAGDSGTSGGIAWADPSNAASGNNCWGNDLGNGFGPLGNGRYASNVNTWLRSPIIDCSGRTGVRLRFRRWLTVQDAAQDVASIWVNGQQLWQNPVGSNLVDNGWQTVEYSVPWADNNPAVQVEWRLVTGQGTNLGGWNIDTFEIGESVIPTADAELRFTPEQVVQGGAMNLTVTTPGNSRPYFLFVGDNIGLVQVPDLPPILIGGNFAIIGGTTDASGNSTYSFNAPLLASAYGQFFYGHVLTVDATFTDFVTSNRSLNWITLTP